MPGRKLKSVERVQTGIRIGVYANASNICLDWMASATRPYDPYAYYPERFHLAGGISFIGWAPIFPKLGVRRMMVYTAPVTGSEWVATGEKPSPS